LRLVPPVLVSSALVAWPVEGGVMSYTWDVFMFALGFASGVGVVLGGFLLARVRRETLRSGDRFLAKLGSVGAQRFLEAVQD
jgi:hypothetical protein